MRILVADDDPGIAETVRRMLVAEGWSVDVVGDGALPFRYDVEKALVVIGALSKLPLPEIVLRVNNRKLAEGFFLGAGAWGAAAALRAVGKLHQIGAREGGGGGSTGARGKPGAPYADKGASGGTGEV